MNNAQPVRIAVESRVELIHARRCCIAHDGHAAASLSKYVTIERGEVCDCLIIRHHRQPSTKKWSRSVGSNGSQSTPAKKKFQLEYKPQTATAGSCL